MNTMSSGMKVGEEMISVSPICKSTPANNKSSPSNNDNLSFASAGTSSPPSVFGNSPPSIIRRPTLQHQHSYAGHEEDMNDDNTVGSVLRAPSGRPFLATRHLSIGDDNSNRNEQEGSPPTHNLQQWSNHPSLRNHHRQQQLFQSPPVADGEAMPDEERQQPPSAPAPRQEEESAEERARREEEESIALAQTLMAEEAMASHRMSADFLRTNSEQFSAEDFAALQDALREEEDVEYDESAEEAEEVDEDMSYDALLRLGERIGDVKTDRWTMIAHKEIAKLETFQYDPSIHTKKDDSDAKMEDIDDSELKCLVCQCTYEEGDQLRRLPCGHCFHRDCVDQWLQTKDCCAYCRQCILPDKDEKKE